MSMASQVLSGGELSAFMAIADAKRFAGDDGTIDADKVWRSSSSTPVLDAPAMAPGGSADQLHLDCQRSNQTVTKPAAEQR
jgi:hypothetical protein